MSYRYERLEPLKEQGEMNKTCWGGAKKDDLTEDQQASLSLTTLYFAAFPEACLLHHNLEIDGEI